MKDIREIEQMSLGELEAEALKEAGTADFSGKAGAEDLIGALARAESLLSEEEAPVLRTRRVKYLMGIAAGLVLFAGIGLSLKQKTPKDTFTDPMMAYAQVEMAFNRIGEGIKMGSGAVEKSGETIRKQMEIMNNAIGK